MDAFIWLSCTFVLQPWPIHCARENFALAILLNLQVLGSLAGTATLLGLVPGLHAGDAGYIACHGPSGDLSGTGLYVWEALLTFVFVFVLYGAQRECPARRHGWCRPYRLQVCGCTFVVSVDLERFEVVRELSCVTP